MPRDTKGRAKRPEGDESMSDAGMAHMKREKSEKDGLHDDTAYPYGLRVHVDHEGLKKLDMEDLPQVGHAVELRAKAQVMGVRAEQREDGKEERHLEMQITHLGIHHKADGMKGEDQGGSGKTPEAGHVTDNGNRSGGDKAKEKSTGKDAYYGRKRS